MRSEQEGHEHTEGRKQRTKGLANLGVVGAGGLPSDVSLGRPSTGQALYDLTVRKSPSNLRCLDAPWQRSTCSGWEPSRLCETQRASISEAYCPNQCCTLG